MASTTFSKFSYQRLKQEGVFHDEDHYYVDQLSQRGIEKTRSSWSRVRKVHVRRRLKIRIPSLKRFLRRKARKVRVCLGKVMKRLKESQSHLGDLFAGNYMFLQVTPTSMKYLDKNKTFKGLDLYGGGFSSKYSFPKDSTVAHV